MIDLYCNSSPNVHKIEIMLEEVGLQYRLIDLDIHKGEQFSPEFTALNPNQKIPVIVVHSRPGAPLVMSESGAILIYLAEKTGRFLPSDYPLRGTVLQWLMFQMSGLGPMFGQLNHFMRQPQADDYGRARYASEARRIYDLVEDRLSKTRYLAGDAYSIADIAVFPWMRTESLLFETSHPVTGLDWPGHPARTRWYREIAARPAVAKALQAIEARRSTASSG
ncbi:glutathione S-transferase family protein, partial [Aminobacter aminovorans]